MTPRKLIIYFIFIGLLFAVGMAQPAMAAFEPGENEEIVGPVMWGVGVIDCPTPNTCTATLRIKMVENCDVSTGAVDEGALEGPGLITTQPVGPESVLNIRLESGSIMGVQCPAIITKVKNWEQNDLNTLTLFSFDAQIMFLDSTGDGCQ